MHERARHGTGTSVFHGAPQVVRCRHPSHPPHPRARPPTAAPFFHPRRSQPLPSTPPPFTPRHPRAKWQGRNILVDDQGTLLPHPYAAMDTSKSTINDMGKKFLEQVLEKARKATGYTV